MDSEQWTGQSNCKYSCKPSDVRNQDKRHKIKVNDLAAENMFCFEMHLKLIAF